MDRNLLSGIGIGLFAGFLSGYFLSASRSSDVTPAAVSAPPGTPGLPQGPNPVDLQNRITTALQVVAADPNNVGAWIDLGNGYYDTKQPQKSVEAYAKALALKPDNPDVLTDQGVMYRDLGQFPKAIANFKRANKVAPKHVQSLFNLGVVYSVDLKQPQEALKAWNQVIETDPNSPQAAQARQGIASLGAQAKP